MLSNLNNKLMKALPAAMLLAGAAYVTAECVNRAKDPYSKPLAEQALNECENRVNTYRELKENDVDIIPYLSNYGKAQVALDSVKATKFCDSRGVHPATYEDAKFLKDSIEAKDCGIEPYKRTDDNATKTYRKQDILAKQILQYSEELNLDSTRQALMKQLLEELGYENKPQK